MHYRHTQILLRALLLLGLMLTATSLRAQWANAYYAGWQQGYNNTGYMPAQKIDFSAVTHINHFALVPRADGTLDDASNSVSAFNANELVTRAHAAGTKVLITVGGWGTDVSFRGATSSAYVAVFVANLVSLMKSRGYDGIDVDWETLTSSDATQYTNFITSLRSALNAVTPRPLLTAATAWQPSIFGQLKNSFDQINLMSYDFSGAWPGWVTWHNSPIYDGGFNFPSTGNPVPSSDGMVNSFVAAGVPAQKLGIGIDFYGYIWSGGDGTPKGGSTDPRQSWTTTPSVQANVPYYTIMQNYYQSQYYRWDASAQASYLSIDNTGSANDKFITYDDETTCKKKVDYVRSKGIGGLIIWELGGGYRPTMPAGQQDLLLQAVKQELGGVPSDVTPPTVSLTSPLNLASVTGVITLTANATDNVGVAGVQFKVDGQAAGSEDNSAPYAISWNSATLSNGSHSISATARDAAGNTNTATVTVNVSNVITDATPPVVTITAPENGSSIAGSVTVSASASDNIGVVGVQFRLNGNALGAEDLSSPYSYAWNTSGAANGIYTLSAVARDAAGNSSTSSVSVVVANAAPPPADSGYSAVAQDNFNRADQMPLAGGKWTSLLNQPGSGTLQLSGSAIQAYSTGGAGSGGGMAWDSLLSNGTGIALTVAAKANDNSYASLFLYVRMSGKDLASGNGYRLRYVDNPSGPDQLSIQRVTGGTNGVDIATASIEVHAGDTLKLIAKNDVAGTLLACVNSTAVISAADLTYNPASWYAWVRGLILPTLPRFDNFSIITSLPKVVGGPDTVRPTIAFTAPSAGAGVSGAVGVSANASDNVGVRGVQFKLDGANLGNEVMVPPYTVSWNTAPVPNGTHTLTATARDAAGNQSSSSVTVTVANSAPGAPALNIYADALQSPWINNSWSATVVFNSTAQKYDGTSAISVTQNAWGALSLHSGNWSGSTGITPALYQSLDFVVYGGPAGASISAMVENDAGASFPQIKCGFVAANTWTVISVPVSQLDPGNVVFHRIDIMEISGVTRTYSVDNIRLVDKTVAGGAQPVSPPGETAADLPKTIELAQNFPNPFNPTTVISYTLSADAHVMIEIFNGIGQRVATLVDDELPAGRHDARFEGSNLASGVYFYRLTASIAGTAAPYIETKRMILAK